MNRLGPLGMKICLGTGGLQGLEDKSSIQTKKKAIKPPMKHQRGEIGDLDVQVCMRGNPAVSLVC